MVGIALALRIDEALGVEAPSLPLPDLLVTVGPERNPPLYFLLQRYARPWPVPGASGFVARTCSWRDEPLTTRERGRVGERILRSKRRLRGPR